LITDLSLFLHRISASLFTIGALNTVMFTQSSITITGASVAGNPVLAEACGTTHARVAHAPAPTPAPKLALVDLTTLDEDDLEDLDYLATRSPSGEAIWQEVVRMLVAREAAKAMHPARGRRTSSAA
jgi:hypothetical protein